MISNDRRAPLLRIFWTVAMVSALGGMAGCTGNNVGPEPPWNLSADDGSADAAPMKLPGSH